MYIYSNDQGLIESQIYVFAKALAWGAYPK
jgi:hypothetical protein